MARVSEDAEAVVREALRTQQQRNPRHPTSSAPPSPASPLLLQALTTHHTALHELYGHPCFLSWVHD